MDNERLIVRRLDKAYSVPVLKQLDLNVQSGEIHGLVGENGAGKTTLVNVLAGWVAWDDGEVLLDGKPYAPRGPEDARAAGISYALQELSTIDTLNVAENIALQELPTRGLFIDQSRLTTDAKKLLELVGLTTVSTHQPAHSLSLAEKQLLEIAKALSGECRLLLLDEPTAALTAPQAEVVHRVITELAQSGVAVVYISHRLDDVLAICERVTVLRDGCVVLCEQSTALNTEELVTSMSGQVDASQSSPAKAAASKVGALKLDNVTTDNFSCPVSFACMAGEIVGLAGLAGAGRSELLATIFGLNCLQSGDISIWTGSEWVRTTHPSQSTRLGVGYVGEDRKTMGIFAGHSVLTNMMLPGLGAPLRLIDRGKELAAGTDLVQQLDIRCDGLGQDIAKLSGGNQQKSMLARWLHCDASILLLDEPTRGVDVATKESIYKLLRHLKSIGKTILLSSSEIEELLTVSDRIIVLSNRKVVATRACREWSEAEILAAAFQEHTGDRQVKMPGVPL